MSKESPFKKLFEAHEEPVVPEAEVSQAKTPPPPDISLSQVQPQPEPRKRGRPATGKRSDDAWIGRTYYVQRETDLDVEDELLKLKRRGIEIDKSELVDALLGAWVKWQQGGNIEIQLAEITPRRKSD
jgi:hypothetical protein